LVDVPLQSSNEVAGQGWVEGTKIAQSLREREEGTMRNGIPKLPQIMQKSAQKGVKGRAKSTQIDPKSCKNRPTWSPNHVKVEPWGDEGAQGRPDFPESQNKHMFIAFLPSPPGDHLGTFCYFCWCFLCNVFRVSFWKGSGYHFVWILV